MNKISLNGLALIRSSLANLEWFLNTSHSKKLSKQAYDLLIKIFEDFKDGVNNLYHFNYFELFKFLDGMLKAYIKLDPYAQAVDIRVIYNLPSKEVLNEGRVIKAAPINITPNG